MTRSKSFRPGVEGLERREVPTISLSSGKIFIQAPQTPYQTHSAQVQQQGDRVIVIEKVNGATVGKADYLLSRVYAQEVHYAGGAGNDTFDNRYSNMPSWGSGYGGHDNMYGGSKHDMFLGGAGNDKLFGYGGSDKLYGEGDNDIMDGGADYQQDLVRGGGGTDTIYAQTYVKDGKRFFYDVMDDPRYDKIIQY